MNNISHVAVERKTMPPKKKTKLSPGQDQLMLFGAAALESTSTQPSAADKKRGDVITWHKFAMLAYCAKYPTSRSGSSGFIHEAYPGTRPDALSTACS